MIRCPGRVRSYPQLLGGNELRVLTLEVTVLFRVDMRDSSRSTMHPNSIQT